MCSHIQYIKAKDFRKKGSEFKVRDEKCAKLDFSSGAAI
jgi:hypothetical protein